VILTLVRELRRSQGRYARAALVLVLLAVALASFTMVSMATRAAEQARGEFATSTDREHAAGAYEWTDGPSIDSEYWGLDPLDEATFAALSADIRDADPEATTTQTFFADVNVYRSPPFFAAPDSVPSLALAEGRAPGRGEVALAPSVAMDLGVEVGDDVSVLAVFPDSDPDITLVVVGILRTPSSDAAWVDIPGAIISPLDVVTVAGNTGIQGGLNADGDYTALLGSGFTWNGSVPNSAVGYTYPITNSGNVIFGLVGNIEVAATTLAALVALATLVAAGVAGRNQGQARSQWVGTMRALGTTRRDVVAATLVEAALTGAVAAVLGGAIGWGVNAALVARTQASNPGTFLPAVAPFPGWALGFTLLLSMLLAGTLGAVPAYWAARTSPSEALKPTAPFDARPTGWRVPTWAFGASALAPAIGLWFHVASSATQEMGSGRWVWMGVAVAILGTVGLISRLMEALVPRVGVLVARSRRPWLFAAGDSLRARPRQATGIATVFAVPGVGLGAFAWVSSVLRHWTEDDRLVVLPWPEAVLQAGLVALAASATLGVAAAVMGVAVWMGRGRDAAEAATRGALGLSRNARQLAAMAESAVAALTGGVVGVTVGAVGASITQLSLVALASRPFPVPATAGQVGARLLLMYAATLVGVVIGSAVVSLWSARSVDARTPVAARRIASTQGAP
jgi:hypothetical protein